MKEIEIVWKVLNLYTPHHMICDIEETGKQARMYKIWIISDHQ